MPILLNHPDLQVEGRSVQCIKTQDCYFQSNDPIGEVDWVFIQGNDLYNRWLDLDPESETCFTLAETGFGSGLNFFHTWSLWLERQTKIQKPVLHYYSFEIAPWSREQLLSVYENFPQYSHLLELFLEKMPPNWQGLHRIDLGSVVLNLCYGEAIEMLTQFQFKADAWFLDGFTPSRNPSFWSAPCMQAIASHTKPGGTFATFTAASQVRKDLQTAGFQVSKSKGFRKREMLRGTLFVTDQNNLTSSQSYIKSHSKPSTKPIAIVGAGYAGLFLALQLAKKGQAVHLYDLHEGACKGASQSHAHVIYMQPKYSNNAFNGFFEQAYTYAVGFYQDFKSQGFHSTGVMHSIHQSSSEYLHGLEQSGWPAHWLELLQGEAMTEKLGISMQGFESAVGIYMPQAGVIQPDKIAACILAQNPSIQLFSQETLIALNRTSDQVHVDLPNNKQWCLTFRAVKKYYDQVVLATGAGSFELLEGLGNQSMLVHDESSNQSPIPPLIPAKLNHWRYPLRPIAGQSSLLASHGKRPLLGLTMPLCGAAYITPVLDGYQSLGSRFYPNHFSKGLVEKDHLANIEDFVQGFQLDSSLIETFQKEIVGGSAATRVQSADYWPLVGPLFEEQAPGLYLMTAFGAKGTLVTPLAAEILSDLILDRPLPISKATFEEIHPGRFLKRFNKKFKLKPRQSS